MCRYVHMWKNGRSDEFSFNTERIMKFNVLLTWKVLERKFAVIETTRGVCACQSHWAGGQCYSDNRKWISIIKMARWKKLKWPSACCHSRSYTYVYIYIEGDTISPVRTAIYSCMNRETISCQYTVIFSRLCREVTRLCCHDTYTHTHTCLMRNF